MVESGTVADIANKPKSHWHWRLLVGYHVVAGVLAGTWIWGPTRTMWDAADRQAFYVLNGSLQLGEGWQVLWALANERWFDVISGIIMVGVLACYVLRGNYEQAARRLAEATYVGLSMLVILAFEREYLFVKMDRPSPSLLLEPFYNLRELLGRTTKVTSNNSFPGDHATVTLIFTLMLWRLAGWRYGLIGLVFAVVCILPRLVGGAHWLTDAVVGGSCVALIGTSWASFTPIRTLGVRFITRIYARLGGVLEDHRRRRKS